MRTVTTIQERRGQGCGATEGGLVWTHWSVVGCKEEGDMRDKGSGCCRIQEDVPLEIRVLLGGPGLRSG